MGFNPGSIWYLNGNVTAGYGGVWNADGAALVSYLNGSGYVYGATAVLQTGYFQKAYFNMSGYTSDYYETSDDAKNTIIGVLQDNGWAVDAGYWRITDPSTGADHQDSTGGISSILDSIIKAVVGTNTTPGAGGGAGSPAWGTLTIVLVGAVALFFLPEILGGLGAASSGTRRRRR